MKEIDPFRGGHSSAEPFYELFRSDHDRVSTGDERFEEFFGDNV